MICLARRQGSRKTANKVVTAWSSIGWPAFRATAASRIHLEQHPYINVRGSLLWIDCVRLLTGEIKMNKYDLSGKCITNLCCQIIRTQQLRTKRRDIPISFELSNGQGYESAIRQLSRDDRWTNDIKLILASDWYLCVFRPNLNTYSGPK